MPTPAPVPWGSPRTRRGCHAGAEAPRGLGSGVDHAASGSATARNSVELLIAEVPQRKQYTQGGFGFPAAYTKGTSFKPEANRIPRRRPADPPR